jgi:hypothetical protein
VRDVPSDKRESILARAFRLPQSLHGFYQRFAQLRGRVASRVVTSAWLQTVALDWCLPEW